MKSKSVLPDLHRDLLDVKHLSPAPSIPPASRGSGVSVGRPKTEGPSPTNRPRILVLEGSGRIGGGQRVTLDMISALSGQADFELVVPGPGELEETAEVAGLRVHRINYPAPVGRFGVADRLGYLPRAAIALRPLLSLIGDQSPDLLYATSRTALLAAVAGRFTGTPVVVHLHMIPQTRKTAWFLRRVCAIDSVKKVMVASTAIAERISLPESKLAVAPNGIDAAQFQYLPETKSAVRTEFRVSDSTHLAALVGEISPEKGQLEAIEALARLRSKAVDASLLVVGEARPVNERYERKLQRTVDGLGLREHVKFAGYREDIPRLLSGIDLLVVPSRGPSGEACPMAVLEAWASGVPVLAANTGGLPDMLANGRGVLFDCGAPDSFAGEWTDMIASPERLHQLSRSGLEAVKGEYSSASAYYPISEAMDQALGRNAGMHRLDGRQAS